MTGQLTAARRFPAESVTDPARCIICHLDHVPDQAVVFRDGAWACEVAPGFEVPGWYFLRLRRHALGWAELERSELTGFGPLVQDLMGALELAFDAPARYLMTFGEAYPHFHAVVTVRTDDIPPESRSGNILALRDSRLDRDAALARVPDVRTALAAVRDSGRGPAPAAVRESRRGPGPAAVQDSGRGPAPGAQAASRAEGRP